MGSKVWRARAFSEAILTYRLHWLHCSSSFWLILKILEGNPPKGTTVETMRKERGIATSALVVALFYGSTYSLHRSSFFG